MSEKENAPNEVTEENVEENAEVNVEATTETEETDTNESEADTAETETDTNEPKAEDKKKPVVSLKPAGENKKANTLRFIVSLDSGPLDENIFVGVHATNESETVEETEESTVEKSVEVSAEAETSNDESNADADQKKVDEMLLRRINAGKVKSHPISVTRGHNVDLNILPVNGFRVSPEARKRHKAPRKLPAYEIGDLSHQHVD